MQRYAGLRGRSHRPRARVRLEFACDVEATLTPQQRRAIKKSSGFRWWRTHKVDAVELVMRAFHHRSFAGEINNRQIRKLRKVILQWLDHYVRQLNQNPFLGVPDGWLSQHYRSAAYLPDFGVTCGDLLSC
jgi:Zn ribbon nucleic-acid-binding protein